MKLLAFASLLSAVSALITQRNGDGSYLGLNAETGINPQSCGNLNFDMLGPEDDCLLNQDLLGAMSEDQVKIGLGALQRHPISERSAALWGSLRERLGGSYTDGPSCGSAGTGGGYDAGY